ncbi:hypothetical protein KM043_014551 [Ampulex compressa]|nr:hypothetical protein KM043_014551 [Ampulex compressa]
MNLINSRPIFSNLAITRVPRASWSRQATGLRGVDFDQFGSNRPSRMRGSACEKRKECEWKWREAFRGFRRSFGEGGRRRGSILAQKGAEARSVSEREFRKRRAREESGFGGPTSLDILCRTIDHMSRGGPTSELAVFGRGVEQSFGGKCDRTCSPGAMLSHCGETRTSGTIASANGSRLNPHDRPHFAPLHAIFFEHIPILASLRFAKFPPFETSRKALRRKASF